jgi:death-on-curing protein
VNWRWIDKQALLLLHGESLAEHGGAAGIRDAGLLDSALARAQNLAAYDDPDIAALAAAYGAGMSAEPSLRRRQQACRVSCRSACSWR